MRLLQINGETIRRRDHQGQPPELGWGESVSERLRSATTESADHHRGQKLPFSWFVPLSKTWHRLVTPTDSVAFHRCRKSCTPADRPAADAHGMGGIATMLLVLLRMVQGLSVGGEYTGSIAFTAELTASHRRCAQTS